MNPELLNLRKQLGITQREMADLLAISRSKYAHLESGRRMMVGPVSASFEALRDSINSENVPETEQIDTENEYIPALIDKIKTIVHFKECELYNLEKALKEIRSLRECSKNSLRLIENELRIFSESSNYYSRLMEMKSTASKKLNKYSSESIEYIELRIMIVSFTIEKMKEFAATKNWKIR